MSISAPFTPVFALRRAFYSRVRFCSRHLLPSSAITYNIKIALVKQKTLNFVAFLFLTPNILCLGNSIYFPGSFHFLGFFFRSFFPATFDKVALYLDLRASVSRLKLHFHRKFISFTPFRSLQMLGKFAHLWRSIWSAGSKVRGQGDAASRLFPHDFAPISPFIGGHPALHFLPSFIRGTLFFAPSAPFFALCARRECRKMAWIRGLLRRKIK